MDERGSRKRHDVKGKEEPSKEKILETFSLHICFVYFFFDNVPILDPNVRKRVIYHVIKKKKNLVKHCPCVSIL